MLQKELSYNKVRGRLKTIVLSHKLIHAVIFGRYTDYVEDKNINYPAVFIQLRGGSIAPGRHDSTIGFRMFVLDRTFVGQDTGENEADVISDSIGITRDLISQIANPAYDDWQIDSSNNLEVVYDYNSDITAGVYIDFNVRIKFYQNICLVPSDVPINEDDMKEVYDADWFAPLDILPDIYEFVVPEEVKNKKVLLVVRSNYTLHRNALGNPASTEFYFSGTSIKYGTPIEPGERTLILYRQY